MVRRASCVNITEHTVFTHIGACLRVRDCAGVQNDEEPGSVWGVLFLSGIYIALQAANLVMQWTTYSDFIKVLFIVAAVLSATAKQSILSSLSLLRDECNTKGMPVFV